MQKKHLYTTGIPRCFWIAAASAMLGQYSHVKQNIKTKSAHAKKKHIYATGIPKCFWIAAASAMLGQYSHVKQRQ